jgi:hypothetical protein
MVPLRCAPLQYRAGSTVAGGIQSGRRQTSARAKQGVGEEVGGEGTPKTWGKKDEHQYMRALATLGPAPLHESRDGWVCHPVAHIVWCVSGGSSQGGGGGECGDRCSRWSSIAERRERCSDSVEEQAAAEAAWHVSRESVATSFNAGSHASGSLFSALLPPPLPKAMVQNSTAALLELTVPWHDVRRLATVMSAERPPQLHSVEVAQVQVEGVEAPGLYCAATVAALVTVLAAALVDRHVFAFVSSHAVTDADTSAAVPTRVRLPPADITDSGVQVWRACD